MNSTKPEKSYLTEEQIKRIIHSANDPIWRAGIVAAMTKEWYNIRSVSRLGLIHFNGNSDTGWQHILDRHAFYSFANHFGKGAHGSPNKFTKSMIPISDFVNIADDIYSTGEIDTKEHPEGNRFVKYSGKSSRYTGANGQVKDFVLILYRGTKIVHSLYPKKSLDSTGVKRLLENLSRDQMQTNAAIDNLLSKILTVNLPYINRSGTIRYILILRINLATQIGKAYLQVNLPNGEPYFCTTQHLMIFSVKLAHLDVLRTSIEFTRFLNTLGITDFTKVEKIIKDIEKKIFNMVA